MRMGRLHRVGGIFSGTETIDGNVLDDVIESVMLDVADTPVLPNPVPEDVFITRRWIDLQPVRTQKLTGGDYLLVPEDGRTPEQVTAEEVRVMRARFLLWRDFFYKRAALDRIVGEEEKRVASCFIGGMYIVPPAMAKAMYPEASNE